MGNYSTTKIEAILSARIYSSHLFTPVGLEMNLPFINVVLCCCKLSSDTHLLHANYRFSRNLQSLNRYHFSFTHKTVIKIINQTVATYTFSYKALRVRAIFRAVDGVDLVGRAAF